MLKDNLIAYKYLCCNKNYQKQSLMETSRNDFLIYTNFLRMITINLFYCEKVFTHMNKWMIGKKFSEISLPEKEDFYIHLKILLMQIT